jgi:hypothetical protein
MRLLPSIHRAYRQSQLSLETQGQGQGQGRGWSAYRHLMAELGCVEI